MPHVVEPIPSEVVVGAVALPTSRLAPTNTSVAGATTTSSVFRDDPLGHAERSDVLVVEDDPIIREQLADRLREEGYSVLTAEDGIDALEVMDRTRIGLIVLDLMLPRMSGWDLLEALRPGGGRTRVPTLVITAFSNAHRVVGAPVFLKPLNTSSLIRAVRAYLGDRN